jgi:hypothetical protein
MRQALIGGDIDTAMTYFVPGAQDRYRTLANDLTVDLPARLAEIDRIELYVLEGSVVQAGAIRREAAGEFAYPVTFVKDENGAWRILGF